MHIYIYIYMGLNKIYNFRFTYIHGLYYLWSKMRDPLTKLLFVDYFECFTNIARPVGCIQELEPKQILEKC